MSQEVRDGLVYLDEGPADGEVVVLVHGWPTSPFLWRRLTPLLAARFRVLVPRLAGTDLVAQADAVAGLLAALDVPRAAAVGHSWGGAVAQLLVARAPVEALVLIDSAAFDEAPPTDLDPRTFVTGGTVELDDLTEDDLGALAAADGPPPAPVDLTDVAAAMGGWDVPIFLLWGEDDPYTPVALAERLNDAAPASTLGIVPESGHFLLEDAFASVGVLILEYLRSRYQGAPHGHEGLVMLQLERRPPWLGERDDRASFLDDDDDDEVVPPADGWGAQEVGPNA